KNIRMLWDGEPEYNVLLALEERSKHPLAKQIRNWLKERFPGLKADKIEKFKETPGQGPEGKLREHYYQIKPLANVGSGSFGLYKNGNKILSAQMEDRLDPEFCSTAKRLKAMGKSVFLLSGDNQERVEAAAKACDGAVQKAFWSMNPLDKEKIAGSYGDALMLGDGVNDALALKAANVGVSVSGGVDLALASSEVYFCKEGLGNLTQLFEGCSKILGILKTNIGLAVGYNVLFIILALYGKISPLAAAILMPLSSIILLSVSLTLLRSLNGILRN
ncbi:MAG: HAD-IC family P-type ATPase, partial [Bacteriovoracaceae bacterium]